MYDEAQRLPESVLQKLKDKLSDAKSSDERQLVFNDLDQRYFLDFTDGESLTISVRENIVDLLKDDACSLEEIFNTYEFHNALGILLADSDIINHLIKEGFLDLKKLLDERVCDWLCLRSVCQNTFVVKKMLSEFMLDKNLIERFNDIARRDRQSKESEVHVRNVFDFIYLHTSYFLDETNCIWCKYYKPNEEILDLNKVNRLLCEFDLSISQKTEIATILNDSEFAENVMKRIVDSNLQDQYDFEQLKRMLTKDDKKKKIKLNF